MRGILGAPKEPNRALSCKVLKSLCGMIEHDTVADLFGNTIKCEQVEQVREAAGGAVRHGREEPVHEIQLQHRGRHGDEHGLKGRTKCAGFPSG